MAGAIRRSRTGFTIHTADASGGMSLLRLECSVAALADRELGALVTSASWYANSLSMFLRCVMNEIKSIWVMTLSDKFFFYKARNTIWGSCSLVAEGCYHRHRQ